MERLDSWNPKEPTNIHEDERTNKTETTLNTWKTQPIQIMKIYEIE